MLTTKTNRTAAGLSLLILVGLLAVPVAARPVEENPADGSEPAKPAVTQPRPDSEPEQDKSDDQRLTAGWDGSHAYIKTADDNFLMKFGGRMQLDYRGYAGSAAPTDSFTIRRARLEAEGHVHRYFEYKVQADFADTGSRKLRDGYLNINYSPALQVKFGQFKAPFSQEELQSSKYIDFVERSSMNNFVPSRTPGFMVHGKADNGLEYAVGLFNGEGTLAAATGDRPEIAVRLRQTLSFAGGKLAFGGAATNRDTAGTNSFRGRTSSHSFSFFSPVNVNGDVQRYNAEFWWTRDNYSFRGEYIQTMQERAGLGPLGVDLPVVVGKGYVAQATYVLTGESKGTGGIKPNASFLNGNGGWGAWELAYRFERMQMDDRANANHAVAHTIGVNWWMNRFVRYQANLAFEQFNDPARSADPGDTSHVAFLTRMQVIF